MAVFYAAFTFALPAAALSNSTVWCRYRSFLCSRPAPIAFLIVLTFSSSCPCHFPDAVPLTEQFLCSVCYLCRQHMGCPAFGFPGKSGYPLLPQATHCPFYTDKGNPECLYYFLLADIAGLH